MKKFRVVLAFVLIALLATVFVACGENNSDNSENSQPSEGLEYTLNEKGNYEYIVTDIGTCTDKNVVIPSEYNSRIVKGIGDNAFKDCTGIESITIPDSVTSIGSNAFEGCANLKSVTIGKGLTSISNKAFKDCNELRNIYYVGDVAGWCGISGLGYLMSFSRTLYIGGKKVEANLTIPATVTNIGDNAFYGCTALRSLTISNGVTSIGEDAFFYCNGLTSVNIPGSVTSIGDSAFNSCSRLTSIKIPDSVTNIGSNAFYGCSELSSIEISNSVMRIGYNAFAYTAWHNDQPNGVVYIGNFAYGYKGTMPSNTSIALRNGTRYIVDHAFSRCAGLTSVNIPGSVTSIGNSAFYGCTGLTSVTIGNGVMSIDDCAFSGCTGLTSVVIPDSVTNIGESAFSGCTGLTSIVAPDKAISIGRDAFVNTAWYKIQANGVVYIGKVAYGYKGTMSNYASITLKNDTLSIADSAFKFCREMSSITIPNSVTIIGKDAFYYCSDLFRITFEGTTSQWRAIGKGLDWNYKVPSFCDVYCTNGTISI